MKVRKKKRLALNAGRNALKADPTRTATLRRAFTAEVRKRFARLKGALIKLIEVEDALGLKERQPLQLNESYFATCPRDEQGHCESAGAKSASILSRLGALPKAVASWAVTKMKERYRKYEERYGPKYAKAIVGAALIGLPLPGGAALPLPVIALAEMHRYLSQRTHNEALDPTIVAKGARELLADIEADFGLATNSFCPTGEGGGVDPHCSPNGGQAGGPQEKRDAEDAQIEAARSREDDALQEKRDTEDEQRQEARDAHDEKTSDRQQAESEAQDTRHEKEDEKVEAAREKEDAQIEKQRDREDAADEKKRETDREKEDERLEKQREKEDAAHDKAEEKLAEREEKLGEKRDTEDEKIQDARDKEDEKREASREKEDGEIVSRHEREQAELDAKPTGDAEEDSRLQNELNERQERELNEIEAKREAEDNEREAARDKEDAEQQAKRDAEDAELRAAQDQLDRDKEARDAAREKQDAEIEARRNAEDKEREDVEAAREKEDAEREARREAEDRARGERQRQEDKDLAERHAAEDKAEADRRVAEDAEIEKRRAAEDHAIEQAREKEDSEREKARDLEDELTANDRWRFASDPAKVKAFQAWLKQQFDETLTSATEEELWRRYTEAGFRRGAGRAFDDVKTRERALSYGGQEALDFYTGTREDFLRSTFARPVAVDKVKLLAGRSFDDLEGVTADMGLRMSRTLTDGLVGGASPAEIARDLAEEVDIGRDRAEVIARTEIIRAHAEGQLTALEQLGVEEVGVAVEWSTAGDDKVCPKCAALEGVVLKLDEARGMLPRHPNCRCSFIPANVGEDTDEQKRSQSAVKGAIRASGADDDWGPGEPIGKDRPQSILNADPLDAFSHFLAGRRR